MSNQSNQRDVNGQSDQREETQNQPEGLDVPSGHEADTGDGEEEAANNSPNAGDLRPGGN